MPTLKHLVIFIYIAELIGFAMLFMGHRRPGMKMRETPIALLCAFMVLRMTVKLVYFYVEFYISSWHLNILWNSIMDTTYALSLYLSLNAACSRAGTAFPRKRLYIAAAVLYVLGFATISFLWVDRASNHLILIDEGIPQLLYNANEAFFLAVAASTTFTVARDARETDAEKLARAISIAVFAYAVYVFLWDVSFSIPGVDALRAIKPFDGVQFFAAALIAILALLCPSSHAFTESDAPVEGQPPSVSGPDLAAFAAEHGLTTREAEVLELLFQGKSTTQVAENLVISVNTAKRHAYNIYRKTGVGSRYELLYKTNHPGEDIQPSISENTEE